eukprot:14968450-Alexandrium_andersonii.AAC.1
MAFITLDDKATGDRSEPDVFARVLDARSSECCLLCVCPAVFDVRSLTKLRLALGIQHGPRYACLPVIKGYSLAALGL